MMRRSRLGWARSALIVVVAGCGSVAATQLASSEVINACKTNASGSLRIVADTATCTADETPLSWNVEGVAGPAAPKQITGLVVADGSSPIGSGFTSARAGAGVYDVDFPAGTWNGTTFPVAVVSCYGSAACVAQITELEGRSDGAATFSVLTTSDGAAADHSFSFVITQS